jgi:hypothetical protein
MKKQLKAMKEPILKELEKERRWQLDLRVAMKNATDDKIKNEVKVAFDESVEYCKVLSAALDEYETLSGEKWKISPDALLTVAANLLGILLVLNFEKLDIIRSKAFGMIIKGRL